MNILPLNLLGDFTSVKGDDSALAVQQSPAPTLEQLVGGFDLKSPVPGLGLGGILDKNIKNIVKKQGGNPDKMFNLFEFQMDWIDTLEGKKGAKSEPVPALSREGLLGKQVMDIFNAHAVKDEDGFDVSPFDLDFGYYFHSKRIPESAPQTDDVSSASTAETENEVSPETPDNLLKEVLDAVLSNPDNAIEAVTTVLEAKFDALPEAAEEEKTAVEPEPLPAKGWGRQSGARGTLASRSEAPASEEIQARKRGGRHESKQPVAVQQAPATLESLAEMLFPNA